MGREFLTPKYVVIRITVYFDSILIALGHGRHPHVKRNKNIIELSALNVSMGSTQWISIRFLSLCAGKDLLSSGAPNT